MASARNAAAAEPSSSSSPYSSSAPDVEILRSLRRLARDLAAADPPAPFLRAVFASVSRRARLLVAVFDDLLLALGVDGRMPRSASLCLREVLLVLQRFKAVVADCSARSRMRLLLQSDEVAARVRELQHDLATLLDILPVGELGLADDVADLLTLASRQCRRRAPEAAAEQELKASVLALIQEVEREIVPERERLETILEEVAINDPASCSQEIEILEREIGDRLAERWTSAMIALVGLLRYAKCVLFSAATPRPLDSKMDADDDSAGAGDQRRGVGDLGAHGQRVGAGAPEGRVPRQDVPALGGRQRGAERGMPHLQHRLAGDRGGVVNPFFFHDTELIRRNNSKTQQKRVVDNSCAVQNWFAECLVILGCSGTIL